MPTGLVPDEDQGVVMAMGMLPDGATLDRTIAYMDNFSTRVMGDKENVRSVLAMSGFDQMSSSVRSSSAAAFIDLTDWSQRTKDEDSSFNLADKYTGYGMMAPEGISYVVNPPAINGMGNFGGFEMWIQNRAGDTTEQLYNYLMQVVAAARQRP